MSEKENYLFVKRDKKTNEFRDYAVSSAGDIEFKRKWASEYNQKEYDSIWEEIDNPGALEIALDLEADKKKKHAKITEITQQIEKLNNSISDIQFLIHLLEKESL
jgi:hypothetical protein